MTPGYEMVVGLEVHIELNTASKIFCGCPTTFGAAPNTQCCPVCAGMPGALPVLNQKTVDYAVLAGLATGCRIAPHIAFDRKNYFYPDLPKAYQITQQRQPLCTDGRLMINTEAGEKSVGIARIHMEEDAGKLLHRGGETLIDLNRCGVPLIEIVSAPQIASADEAVAYLKKLRAVVLYLGISTARMNEGAFRCDVNLSVRKKGAQALGTRTEIKNLNSFAFVHSAITHEFRRQVQLVEQGRPVVQQTRRFDAATKKTCATRHKENADDYRYFPEPDLMPAVLPAQKVAALRKALPRLPDERKALYMQKYGLSAYHSETLALGKPMADFFEAAADICHAPKQLAMLLLGEGLRLMDSPEDEIPIPPAEAAKVADLFFAQQINNQGAKALLQHLWAHGGRAEQLADELSLRQHSSSAELGAIVSAVLAENPQMVSDYKSGKAAALKALMGAAMKKADGRANPRVLNQLLLQHLAEML